jgi:hypothetical protein
MQLSLFINLLKVISNLLLCIVKREIDYDSLTTILMLILAHLINAFETWNGLILLLA